MQQIPGLAQPEAHMGVLLVYVRLQAFMLMLPGLGERVVPARVKVAFAMALAPLMAGFASPPGGGDAAVLIVPAIAEMLIGFSAGALVRLLTFSIDIAASAIAATTSLAQLVGGVNEAAPHPVGNLLHLGGLAVLFALGLPMMVVQLMADSFAVWPPGSLPQIQGLLPAVIEFTARGFGLAMMLAAPFILGGFLYQALSGVINKVMPALPVMFIAAPGSILLALIGLVVLAPMIVGIWADAVLSTSLPGMR